MFETKVKILIIDDRPENLHAMKVTLEPLEDVEIFTAQSGNEGLSKMLEHEFAVVLLDVQMPEMDGFETASLMQNHRATRNVPIIFVTAINKEDSHVFKGYKSGAVDYLFKPLNLDILLSKVKVFIRLFRQRKECEMMQEELQKAKNIEALGVLAGGIAHDFNNLLTAIFGYIELAKTKSDPEGPVLPLLEKAKNAAERTRHLTQQLVTFSKGGGPIKARADVLELLQETSALMLSGSSIKVEIEASDPVGRVDVDRGQINQVFQNLLLNAKEAMPDGGTLNIKVGNITIDHDCDEPLISEGRYVKITFTDNGPGIDEAILTKIFDPYFTTKHRGKNCGQGLGLSISHSIVIKHGGYLLAESGPDQGATFHVYLPMPDEKKLPVKDVKTAPVPQPSSTSVKRLMIMEDEENVAATTRDMLQFLGYEVEIATDGTEAIAVYSKAREENKPFDAVILDLTIRGGEGGEKVLAKLLKIEPGIKAIVSSGYAENPIMADFRQYGFSGVVKKPFSLDALNNAIKKLSRD